jgi:hypothetical protein
MNLKGVFHLTSVNTRYFVYLALGVLFIFVNALPFSRTGVKATMTQPTSQTAFSSTTDLILEIMLQPAQGSPEGSRVFSDGRYEFLSDFEIVVGYDGKTSRKPVDLKWRGVFQFTNNELAELRTAILEADFEHLQAEYKTSQQSLNTSTMTWRVLLGNSVKQVVVYGYPNTKVPALDKLYLRFNQIHKGPQTSSAWQVLTKNGIVKRTINCDVSSVEFLRPVLQALFASDSLDSSGTSSALPAPDAVLLEILWKQDGKDVETTRLYGDGRYELSKNGAQSLVKTLSPAQIVLVEQTLNAIAWKDLPEPVCEQPPTK